MILLISPKNVDATQRLIRAASELQLRMDVFDVNELAERKFEVDFAKYDVLYIRYIHPFYKEVIELAKNFKTLGKRVVDGIIAEGWLETSKKQAIDGLKNSLVTVPKTMWLEQADATKYPFMLKWDYGFGGKDTHFIGSEKDLSQWVDTRVKDEWLWQEYIDAEHEYKVITVGYESLPKILKFEYSKNSHRPDFGKWQAVDASSEPNVVHLAEKSASILQRELAKVDIIQQDGDYYVLEVNRSPGLDQYTNLTGIDVAKEFLWYVVE